MPKADPEGLQKHTLHLYEGDFEKLQALNPGVSGAEIVRKLVRSFIESKNGTTNYIQVESHIDV